jgi:hypothetical protein
MQQCQREADRETVRRHPRLARASAKLAAVEVLLEATGWDGGVGLDEVWASIEAVLPHAAAELRARAGRGVSRTRPPSLPRQKEVSAPEVPARVTGPACTGAHDRSQETLPLSHSILFDPGFTDMVR